MHYGSTNTKVQFVLRYTKGVSSTESLINHLKSKHRIHVHKSKDHKTIPAQEEIRSQNCETENESFWVYKEEVN